MWATFLLLVLLLLVPDKPLAFSLSGSSRSRFYPRQHVASKLDRQILLGSIYAPDGKDGDNDTEGNSVRRDHLGLKTKTTGDGVGQPISSWANSNPSSAENQEDIIQQAVEKAVSQASKLEEEEEDNNNNNNNKSSSSSSSNQEQIQKKTPDKVPVRFINFDTMGGIEKVTLTTPGTNILKLADDLGIRIPRQCRTGLCGSCTADVKDPTWTQGDRVGFQTIRTCQAGAMLPAACDEMVVDCFRMARDSRVIGSDATSDAVTAPRPPSNFDDGWEAEFTPDYKTSLSKRVTIERAAGRVQVMKNNMPEYTVNQGRVSSIEIDKPHWTPRIDANIPPWETIW